MKVKYIDQRNFTYSCLAMFCIDKTYSLIFSSLYAYVSFQYYCFLKLGAFEAFLIVQTFGCLYLSGHSMNNCCGCETKYITQKNNQNVFVDVSLDFHNYCYPFLLCLVFVSKHCAQLSNLKLPYTNKVLKFKM